MAKGFYLTIGLNNIDSKFYSGDILKGCVNDANDYAQIAESQGFQKPRNFSGQQSATLVDEDATRQRIMDEIKDVAAQMSGDDIFFLHFSGHGMETGKLQLPGLTTKANDTLWCTYDKPLPDKFLFDAWFSFPNESHPPDFRQLPQRDDAEGTGKRNLGGKKNQEATRAANPDEFAQLSQDIAGIVAARQGKTPGAGVLLLAACQDDEESRDGGTNGLFTGYLKQVWANGAFKDDYRKFHLEIASLVSQDQANQNPNRTQVGNPVVIGDFPLQSPFQI